MRNQKLTYALILTNLLLVGAVIFLLRGKVSHARGILAQTTPHLISYQGTLTDDQGDPINGTKDLTITVYASESSITPLWVEFHDDVAVNDGAFAILLGENTPLPDNLFGDPSRWMGIQVDGVTLTPWQRFTSVPYALNADKLDGHDASDFTTGDLPSGAIVWFRGGNNPSGFTRVTDVLPVDVGDWEAMPEMPAGTTRTVECDVWTGSEILCWNEVDVFGGDEYGATPTGARYDATSNTWSLITNTDAPVARSGRSAVWTGSEMIVWGGATDMDDFTWIYTHTNTGGRYNLSTDSWTATSTADADTPTPRSHHGAVWTGSQMMVWGGLVGGSMGSDVYTNTGALYNPATNTWDPVAVTGAPDPMGDPAMVWTGSKVIVWGENGGALYDPDVDTWTPMSNASVSESSYSIELAVWTGSEMAVVLEAWNGHVCHHIHYYDPTTDTWRRSRLHLGTQEPIVDVALSNRDWLLLSNGTYHDLVQDTELATTDRLPSFIDPARELDNRFGWVWTGGRTIIPQVDGSHGIMHDVDLLSPYVKE